MKKKLLWIGDAGCPSGFALATHKTLETLHKIYDVTVLGINYRGDPHEYPYPIFAAAPGGDFFGVGRLPWMCAHVEPDVIVIQQDGWNIPFYIDELQKLPKFQKVPVIVSLAVDGKNFQGPWLEGISLAIFWTKFAMDEARNGLYRGPATVIPLGVDLDTYWPMDRLECRSRRLPKDLDDAFIVGNVNRNQPRKRWDLTIQYFAEWIKSKKISDAFLYLHAAPTGEAGVDVKQLARYYGVLAKLAFMEPPVWYGVSEQHMRDTYNCFDVQISTTQGEGFGLTTFEGMACGVPQIVPNWAALGELTADAAIQIPCSNIAIGMPYVNVIGGVPDKDAFITALDTLYNDKEKRAELSKAGLELVKQDRFRWASIGKDFAEAIQYVLAQQEAATV